MTNKTNKKNKRPQPTERRVVYVGREYRITTPYDKRLVDGIKTIPGAHWDDVGGYWAVPPWPDSLARLVEVCREYQIGADAATAAVLAAAVPGANLIPLPPAPVEVVSVAGDRLAALPTSVDPALFELAHLVSRQWPKGSLSLDLALPVASLRVISDWLDAHGNVRELWTSVLAGLDTTKPAQVQQAVLHHLMTDTWKLFGVRLVGGAAELLRVSVCLPDGRGGYAWWGVKVSLSEDLVEGEMNMRKTWQDEADEGDEEPDGALVVCAVTSTNSVELERVFNLMLVYSYELGLRASPWHMA